MSPYVDRFLYVFMTLSFAGALWMARDWPADARVFPLLVGGAGLLVAVIGGFLQLAKKDSGKSDPAKPNSSVKKELSVFAWMGGFFAAVAFLGFQWGLPASVFVYLKLEAGLKILSALVFALCGWIFLYAMREALHLPLYDGYAFTTYPFQ